MTYNFQVTDFDIVQRFLMLGTTNASYCPASNSGGAMSLTAVDRALNVDYTQVLHLIETISVSGRAPKNDPAVALLAYVAAKPAFAEEAFAILGKVCRIGTHLFQFVGNYKAAGGKWNAVAKRAVSAWYTARPDNRLAVQLLKYQQRNGWSHGDVLRLAHVKPGSEAQSAMFRYAARAESSEALPSLYADVARLNGGDMSSSQVINMIETNKDLSWEMIPSKYRGDAKVLSALVPNMGLTAVIRQLGLLTSHGVTNSSEMRNLIVSKITDKDALKNGRVHPITILNAFKTYGSGRGVKGSLVWSPDYKVSAALDDAFYLAFDSVEDTGQHMMVGVDISGSMQGATVCGMDHLRASEVAVVMSMAAVRTQKNAEILGFGRRAVNMGITADMSLQTAMRKYQNLHWDGSATNCSVIFDAARDRNQAFEKFVFVTDNDINCGDNPMTSLREYRRKTKLNAKMAVIATSLSNLSIADPTDRGCLDIAGFDSAAPALIADL